MKKTLKTLIFVFALIAIVSALVFSVSAKDGDAIKITYYDANGNLKDTVDAVAGTPILLKDTAYSTDGGGTFFGWFTESGDVYAPGAEATFDANVILREAYGVEVDSTWSAALVDKNWSYVRLTEDVTRISNREQKCTVIDLNGHNITLTDGIYLGRAGMIFIGEGTVTANNNDSNKQLINIQKHVWSSGDGIRFWVGKNVTVNTGMVLLQGDNNFAVEGASGSAIMYNAPELRIYGTVTAYALFRSNGTVDHVTKIYSSANVTVTGPNAVINNSGTDVGMGISIDKGATFNVTSGTFTNFFSGMGEYSVDIAPDVRSNAKIDLPTSCGMEFVSIPATPSYYATIIKTECEGHSFVEGVSAACAGKIYSCENCGAMYVDTKAPVTADHTWQTVNEYPATCKKGSSIDRECTVCGVSEVGVVISEDPIPHAYFSTYTEDAQHVYFQCEYGCGSTLTGDVICRWNGGGEGRPEGNGNMWGGHSNVYVKITVLLPVGEEGAEEEVTGYIKFGESDESPFNVEQYSGKFVSVKSSVNILGYTINPKEKITKIVLPEGCTGFGTSTLSGMTALTELTLSSTIIKTNYNSLNIGKSYALTSDYISALYKGDENNSGTLSNTFFGDAGLTNITNTKLIFPVGITKLDASWLGTTGKTLVFLGDMTLLQASGYWSDTWAGGQHYIHDFAFSLPNMNVSALNGTFVPTTAIAADGTITFDIDTTVKAQTGTLTVSNNGLVSSSYVNVNYMKIIFCQDDVIAYLVDTNTYTLLKLQGEDVLTCTGVDTDGNFTFEKVETCALPDVRVLYPHIEEAEGICFCGDPVVLCEHLHTTTTPGTPATCMAPGVTDKIVCDDCTTVLQDAVEIPQLDHDFENGTIASLVYENGFAQSGVKSIKCATCTTISEETITTAPIFTANGYSVNGTEIYSGYTLNIAAYNEYNTVNGGTLKFGIVVADQTALSGNGVITTDEAINSEYEGACVMKSFGSDLYTRFGYRLSGFTSETLKDAKLFISLYVIDGDNVSYIQSAGSVGEEDVTIGNNTFKSITFNQIVALVPTPEPGPMTQKEE